jgi:pyruvate-formate lyase-activating enzyme
MKFVKKKSMESASKALKKKKNRNTVFWVETPFIPGVTPVPEKVAKAIETFSDPHLQRSLRAHGLID